MHVEQHTETIFKSLNLQGHGRYALLIGNAVFQNCIVSVFVAFYL